MNQPTDKSDKSEMVTLAHNPVLGRVRIEMPEDFYPALLFIVSGFNVADDPREVDRKIWAMHREQLSVLSDARQMCNAINDFAQVIGLGVNVDADGNEMPPMQRTITDTDVADAVLSVSAAMEKVLRERYGDEIVDAAVAGDVGAVMDGLIARRKRKSDATIN